MQEPQEVFHLTTRVHIVEKHRGIIVSLLLIFTSSDAYFGTGKGPKSVRIGKNLELVLNKAVIQYGLENNWRLPTKIYLQTIVIPNRFGIDVPWRAFQKG